ncbi:MAG: cyclic beta 1-2 glucan synthetase, partial [Casimicrobiaceae bacterium]
MSTCADAMSPDVQLLSNGSYHVSVTDAGGGASRWNDLALTRWRDDATCDDRGSFYYLRDVDSGRLWSAAHQPTRAPADSYRSRFTQGRAEFIRRDGDIDTHTTVAVASAFDVELRRVRIVNHGASVSEIDVTSYMEIVLGDANADRAHPAFANLFVETEWLEETDAILCTRRPQQEGAPAPWMFHLLSCADGNARGISFDTDRRQFIGRCCSTQDAAALSQRTLGGSVGAVLDPIAALRTCVTLTPGGTATLDFFTGVAATREACVALAQRCRVANCAAALLAEPAAQPGAKAAHDASAESYRRLAASMLYANPSLRADAATLAQNTRGQSGLWGFRISGDLPIALLWMSASGKVEFVREMVLAHAYWRAHGLASDLVIVTATPRDAVMRAVDEAGGTALVDQRGGIIVLVDAELDEGARILLQTVARVVVRDDRGTLAQQLDDCTSAAHARDLPASSGERSAAASDAPVSPATRTVPEEVQPDADREALALGNGIGGFSADGREYVIHVSAACPTPQPWVNVLANPEFGTLVSESGSANTWSENAQAFRLTPWSNDAVADANTEAIYIRDEDSGHFWSPTLLPCGGTQSHTVRHGFGYSIFTHAHDGIDAELGIFVAVDAPVRYSVLKLVNRSGRKRTLSVTGYVQWVLGEDPGATRMHVVTERDAGSGALLAHNSYNTDFASRVAFFCASGDTDDHGCDRAAFLGRNGTLRNPLGMSQPRLSARTGAGLDPCAVLRVRVTLAAGASDEVVFRLGAASSAAQAQALASEHRDVASAHAELAAVRANWRQILGTVQVKTPVAALDVMANGWLLYQVLSCRMWARNAFYQSSGAYGFRDQLQDSMALVHARPDLVREHLLRCASRQFVEGDVQHWWHPPSGRGVRTRCSDDYLWLPFVACHYVEHTGDIGVLDAVVPFLEGNAPAAGEASVYELPRSAAQASSLYDHCVRAIERGFATGTHGLPLMGSCDWNDGMNLVGAEGKGESVWLAFFLGSVLDRFGALAARRADTAFAQRCADARAKLRSSVEATSFDGAWYRRAWFDDGTPLGVAA